MSKAPKVVTRTGIPRVAFGCAAMLATLALTAGSSMATTVALTTAPNLPTLTGVTLNGQSQSTFTIWSNAMKITSSGTNNGWNLTVNGNSAVGKSAVFKQYCPNATCGTDQRAGIRHRRVHASGRLAHHEHQRSQLDVRGPPAGISMQRQPVLQDRPHHGDQGGVGLDQRGARRLDRVGFDGADARNPGEPAKAADKRGLPRRRRVDAQQRPVNL